MVVVLSVRKEINVYSGFSMSGIGSACILLQKEVVTAPYPAEQFEVHTI